MKKYWNLVIVFLIWIFFTLFYKYGVMWSFYNEMSYKMNWVEPRYVKFFRYTPIVRQIENKNVELLEEKNIYFERLRSIIPNTEDILSKLDLDENIYIFIKDLWNFWITADIKNWKINLEKWINENLIPSMVFNLNKEDIDWIQYFFSDGILDEKEKLKMADVLLVWVIENLYRQNKFYKNTDMSMFKFDNFMQFEIKNDKYPNLLRAWKNLDLKVTIINVDWQWIIKKWFYGDPDIRFSISLDESLKFYKMVSQDLKKVITKKEAINVSKKAFNILISNITYVRKDHK